MPDYSQLKEALRAIPPAEKLQALSEATSDFSTEEKKQVIEALGGIQGPLNDKTRNALWILVVSAFVVVLVGSFATLAWAVFHPPESDKVKPEIILSLFTSVVGFLAGLFVPSPARSGGTTS